MPTALDLIQGAEFPQQDYIVLGGLTSPGRAEITDCAFERRYDVREPYGAAGGSTVWQGDSIKRAVVQISLWEASHFADWETFAKGVLFKKPGRVAYTVDHPVLKLIHFTECQVEKVTGFQQTDTGIWQCEIHLLEFRRPKPALSKPVAAIPNAPKPVPTAQDAADIQIQQLTAQVAALAPVP